MLLGLFRRMRALACVHLEDCLLLYVGFCTSEAPSDINRGSKPAFQHIARDVKRRRDGAAAHIASVDGPFVEMSGLHGFACSVIRIFADPARAKDATVTYLKQATFQMLGHDIPVFLADSIPPRAYSHPVAGTAMPTFSTATVRQPGRMTQQSVVKAKKVKGGASQLAQPQGGANTRIAVTHALASPIGQLRRRGACSERQAVQESTAHAPSFSRSKTTERA
jgi:hypothetical protein